MDFRTHAIPDCFSLLFGELPKTLTCIFFSIPIIFQVAGFRKAALV